jgi:4-hydroxy-3-methylbut-2-enyl diphosphate reductase
VEVARNLGTSSHLIDSFRNIRPEWLEGVKTIALTAGASAPECLVEEVVKFLDSEGFNNVQELEVMPENVRFGLPPEIVQAIASAPASVSAD